MLKIIIISLYLLKYIISPSWPFYLKAYDFINAQQTLTVARVRVPAPCCIIFHGRSILLIVVVYTNSAHTNVEIPQNISVIITAIKVLRLSVSVQCAFRR